jgi:hypothetical protein
MVLQYVPLSFRNSDKVLRRQRALAVPVSLSSCHALPSLLSLSLHVTIFSLSLPQYRSYSRSCGDRIRRHPGVATQNKAPVTWRRPDKHKTRMNNERYAACLLHYNVSEENNATIFAAEIGNSSLNRWTRSLVVLSPLCDSILVEIKCINVHRYITVFSNCWKNQLHVSALFWVGHRQVETRNIGEDS